MKALYTTFLAVFVALTASAQALVPLAAENFEDTTAGYVPTIKYNSTEWKESIILPDDVYKPASTDGDTNHLRTNGNGENPLYIELNTVGFLPEDTITISWSQHRDASNVYLKSFSYSIDGGLTVPITNSVMLEGTSIVSTSKDDPVDKWYRVSVKLPVAVIGFQNVRLIWVVQKPNGSNHGKQYRFDNLNVDVFTTRPYVIVKPTSLAFEAINGMSSVAQPYQLSGYNLESAVSIVAPASFRISLSAEGPYVSTLSDTLRNEMKLIYVRYDRPVTPVGMTDEAYLTVVHTGNITHEYAGVFQTPVSLTGSQIPPILTVSISQLSFDALPGDTSAPQSYKLSVANLVNDVTITVPDNFLISFEEGEGYVSELTFNQTIDTASTTIFVRYIRPEVPDTLTEEEYNGVFHFGDITNASVGITSNNVVSVNGGDPVPLAPFPVELASFQGSLINGAAKLVWTTATEKNNKMFVVERSQDGKDYSGIGEVKGGGNSSTKINYSFTDHAPLGGVNYYRLRQKDTDGTSSFSKVVALELAAKGLLVSVYPTVATQAVRITLQSATDTNATIKVVDITGRTVAFIHSETNLVELPVNNLKSGIYFLHVTDGQNHQVQRFIKE